MTVDAHVVASVDGSFEVLLGRTFDFLFLTGLQSRLVLLVTFLDRISSLLGISVKNDLICLYR